MSKGQISPPTRWLMTDERIGDRLLDAIRRLPAGHGGVVFRHYRTVGSAREQLAARVARLCRERGLALSIARDVALARAVGADYVHNAAGRGLPIPLTMAVHDPEEAARSAQLGAALLFVSPVAPTRSHPGRPELSPDRLREIAALARAPMIALGGMDEKAFEQLSSRALFHGWAGIGAWLDSG